MILDRLKALLFGAILASTLAGCSSSDEAVENDELQNTGALRLVSNTINEADGSVVTITTEYGETGNLLSQVFQRDGSNYLTTTFESNVDGQFIRRSEDNDGDGVENTYSTYEYTDDLGLVRINRHGSDGLIGGVTVFSFEDGRAVVRDTYDVQAAASSELVDLSTGVLTAQRAFEYVDNQIITSNIDSDANGEIDRREDFSYNPDGTLATTVITTLSTGATDSSIFVYESGPCNGRWSNSASSFFCVDTD